VEDAKPVHDAGMPYVATVYLKRGASISYCCQTAMQRGAQHTDLM
jgi:hypothetical protein